MLNPEWQPDAEGWVQCVITSSGDVYHKDSSWLYNKKLPVLARFKIVLNEDGTYYTTLWQFNASPRDDYQRLIRMAFGDRATIIR